MQAWLSAAPGLNQLELTRLPLPDFGEEEALIRVDAAALNFSDLLMIDDRYQVRPPRPFVPGQEVSGVVAAAGARSGLQEGQRVVSKVLWGGFAEYARIEGRMAIAMPDGVSSAIASALPIVYVTAAVALTECTKVRPGETVLVLAAAGGVGLAAVEIARNAGARVIAAAGGTDKCDLARKHGAEIAVDYRRDGWAEDVKRLTKSRGVDVIFDPVGGDATKEALRLIARDGRLLIVGFTSGEIPQIPANRLLLKRAAAIGVYWNHDDDADMLKRVNQRLSDNLRNGIIRPHLGATFDFEKLPDALHALQDRKTTGKVILQIKAEASTT